MKSTCLPLYLAVISVFSGCASVTGTTGQSVSVETRQKNGSVLSGASCELTNSKGKWFITTPGSASIRRSNDDMIVVCNKDGHEPGTAAVVSDTKGMMFGNILIGGGIGALVDHNTGAAYEYPTLIQIMMGSNLKIEPPKANAENTTSTQANLTNNPQTTKTAAVETKSNSTPTTAKNQSTASSPPSKSISVTERLKELNNLHKQGLISTSDYESKKAEILKSM